MLKWANVTALVAPTLGPAWLIDPVLKDRFVGGGAGGPATQGGYPHLPVPMGLVDGLPVGLSFVGPARREARMLAYGFADEQASHARRPPTYARATPLDPVALSGEAPTHDPHSPLARPLAPCDLRRRRPGDAGAAAAVADRAGLCRLAGRRRRRPHLPRRPLRHAGHRGRGLDVGRIGAGGLHQPDGPLQPVAHTRGGRGAGPAHHLGRSAGRLGDVGRRTVRGFRVRPRGRRDL